MNKRIRHIREYLGLSQRMMAKEVGVAVSNWSRIENTDDVKPSGKMLFRLAEIGVSLDWLFTGKGSMMLNQSISENTETTEKPIETYQPEEKQIETLENVPTPATCCNCQKFFMMMRMQERRETKQICKELARTLRRIKK